MAQSESESRVKFLHGMEEPCRFMTMRLDVPYHEATMRFEAEVGTESLEMSSEEWRDLGCPETFGIYIALPKRKPVPDA